MASAIDTARSSSGMLGDLAEAYQYMEMPQRRYALFVVIPATIFFVATVILWQISPFQFVVNAALVSLGLLAFVSAVAYPKIEMDSRRVELENQYHLIVTHMTVLSVTNIDRMSVFRTIANDGEYGEFAAEFRRIVQLVDTWNQSLDDACRRRAKIIPSDTIADFFERLAYTLGAGQTLDEFLLNEQSVMIEKYTTVYESTLENLDVLKDLYLSMLISMTFALVFAVVLPILTGTDPTLTVGVVLVVFVFVQLGFYVAIQALVPYDPIWFQSDLFHSRADKRATIAMAIGFALSVLLLAILAGSIAGIGLFQAILPPDVLPMPLYIALPLTPLAIPGAMFHLEEAKIKARDQEFPAFIRALGAAESAKQSTTSRVLQSLRQKDFGPLTDEIDGLYRRLNMRIDTALAWRTFAGESNSYLIQKFSEMYLVAREMGGSPKQLGELIGRNMNVVIQLREHRRQKTVTLIGVLYGITAASAFSFFVALEIVKLLAGMDLALDSPAGFDFGQLLYTEHYSLEMIEYLIYIVILFNAVLSSLMIRTTDGGHKGNAYLHFVAMTWIACLTAVLTTSLISGFLYM